MVSETQKEPWFIAANWEPYKFKGYTVPYVAPVEVQQAFNVPAPVQVYQGIPATIPASVVADEADLDLPPPPPPPAIPGLVGELVQWCWNASPWQIAEVSIASALSIMSLLCSRSYRHGSLGLSLYLLVLAQTSTGKSFGFKANDVLITALTKLYEGAKPPFSEEGKKRVAACKQLIMGEIGSAQGLAQHMAVGPSTLVHADEFVEHIKIMAQLNPPIHKAELRAELLRLTEKSGPGTIYRGRKYSKRSNTQEEVDVIMASLSILATGTPQAFYDDISTTLLTNGLLPRFTVLEFTGNLTRKNLNPIGTPSAELIRKVSNLFNMQYERGQIITGDINEIVDVQAKDQAAFDKMNGFENLCLRRIIDANDRDLPTAGLWSRAKEHVRQIASLIAIGVNPQFPLIDLNHVEVAISIVRPSLEKLAGKVDQGETGSGDERRRAEMKRIMARMYVGGYERFKGYPGANKSLMDSGVIQVFLVRNQCSKLSAFRNHPHGGIRAFNDAFNDMVRYREVEMVDGSAMCCKINLASFANVLKHIAEQEKKK